MWCSLTVLLMAACLAHTEASRPASLRSRRMVVAAIAPNVPWQAMVYISDRVLDGGYAGGALISDRWVLTAGRNLFVRKTREDTQGREPVIPKLYLGIRHKTQANATTQVAIEKIVLHPGFQNKSDWDNDLALIQLKEPVVMSDTVMPIPLPERGQDFAENSGAIAGWGWGIDFLPSPSLKHLVLPLTDNSACGSEYGDDLTPVIDDSMFCTGPARYGGNVCFGDAGGVLAIRDDKTGDVYAAGVLSYDKVCRTKKHAVYMKITSYLPWIHSVMRGDTEKSSALRSKAMSEMERW